MKNGTSDKEYLMVLGKRIRARRKEMKLSQLALSNECNIEKANVSRLEGGKLNPTILTLKKVAIVLFGSLSELLKD